MRLTKRNLYSSHSNIFYISIFYSLPSSLASSIHLPILNDNYFPLNCTYRKCYDKFHLIEGSSISGHHQIIKISTTRKQGEEEGKKSLFAESMSRIKDKKETFLINHKILMCVHSVCERERENYIKKIYATCNNNDENDDNKKKRRR